MRRAAAFAIALALTALFAVPALAADAPDISASASVSGGTAEYFFSISGNPGISGAELTISYDAAVMTPAGAEAAGLWRSDGIFLSNLQQGGDLSAYDEVTIIWVNTGISDGDGALFGVSFTLKDASAQAPKLTVTGTLVSGDDGSALEYTLSGMAQAKQAPLPPVVVPPKDDEPEETPDYSDVAPGDWFYSDVAFVSSRALMSGTGDGLFSPYIMTTRGMIVTVLYRLEGSPAVSGGIAFSDVPEGKWYSDAVKWAASCGVAGGYGDGSFGPLDVISREQLAAILFRYAGNKGQNVSASADLTAFADAEKISPWALDALSWANACGLVTGRGDGVLDPSGGAMRCEAAAVLHRFCELT